MKPLIDTDGGTAVAEAPARGNQPKVSKKNQLSAAEKTSLAKHEDVIQHHFESFKDAGNALVAIRSGKLYRETHATFDDYCRERWEMSKTQANRLIAAAQVVENVSTVKESKDIVDHLTESAVRPLAALNPAQQRRVIAAVVKKAPAALEGRGVTAKLVTSIARQTVPSAFKKKAKVNGQRPSAGDLIRRSEVLGQLNAWEKVQMAAGKFAKMSARDCLAAVREIIVNL